jgi:hypothetical protein
MSVSWQTTFSCPVVVWAACAVAQNAPPAAPPPASAPAVGQPPVYDPGQLPAYTGRVQQFTLTPRGDIDGLILRDGTEVKTPPHLSTAMAYSVKPGDAVTVHGLRAASLPLIQAVSITDQADGRTVIDSGPTGPPAPPPPPSLGPGPVTPLPGLTEVQGRVRMTLHGAQGEANGALLEDGTLLRLPPPGALTVASLLQPGQNVVAEGVGLANPIGKVLEVEQIGPTRDQLSFIDTPPGPGPRRPPPRP